MNSGAIFLLHDDRTLVEMREQPYDSEDLLQTLLADYPSLLAGELMNPSIPRRWLLVKREAGVPSGLMQSDRWSMDHLFLDQDGVPTIVEVKRSSDTRIRREVVGQMMDYAANAVVYWPVNRIRGMFEETCAAIGLEPKEAVQAIISSSQGLSEDTVENYWQSVERNFQAKRIRMVFVADSIPVELQRIVEFMNEQMNPSEVLAIEVRQYVGQGGRTLVPRIFGLTAEAQSQKRSQSAPSTDEATFLAALPTDYAEALRRFFDYCRAEGLTTYWGTTGCSIRTMARSRSSLLSIAWINPPGRAGWAGLTDITLGVDRGSLEAVSPHLIADAEAYASQAGAIPGSTLVQSKGMRAHRFSPEAFVASQQEITGVVGNFAQRLKVEFS